MYFACILENVYRYFKKCLKTDSSLRLLRASDDVRDRDWADWTVSDPPDWFPTAVCACDELPLSH